MHIETGILTLKKIIILFILILLSSCNGEVNIKSEASTGTLNIDKKVINVETKINKSEKNNYKEITNETIDFKKIDLTLKVSTGNKDFKKYIPIFMFHYIKDIPSNSLDQIQYRLSFSPKKLENFLIYFKENNIKTLTFWDLKNIIENKKDFPKKAVILSFDDGHIDHYNNVFPLLKKYNMKWVFFIISNKPWKDPLYANWDQIKEMSLHWQEIGSHTKSHFNLTTLSDEKLKEELEWSKNIIENKINKPVISLCYPSWKYNKRVIKEVEKNYLFARTVKWWKIFSLSKKYEIPTVRMFPNTGIASLKIWFKN